MPIPVANSSRKVLRAALLVATLAALLYQFPTHILLKHRAAEPKAAAADMDPSSEIEYDMPGVLRLHKSGRVERFDGTETVPPSPSGDPANGVASKDVVLDPEANISARLYLPAAAAAEPGKKLPVVVFFHGGAFMVHTAASPLYHKYAASLAAAAPAVVVSVDYRLAPEHRLPAAYDDAFAALRAVVAACRPGGAEPWLAAHGDASRLVLAGDSAGANIVHEMLVRAAASEDGDGPRIEGAILLHPWFSGSEAIEGEHPAAPVFNKMIWSYACPGAVGATDDPRINPLAPGAPSLEKLACDRMLVCAAQKDVLATRIRAYHQAVAAAACRDAAAWFESEGEDHVFFLGKPDCESAKQLLDRIVAFVAGA